LYLISIRFSYSHIKYSARNDKITTESVLI
jgi:hypothetical protein